MYNIKQNVIARTFLQWFGVGYFSFLIIEWGNSVKLVMSSLWNIKLTRNLSGGCMSSLWLWKAVLRCHVMSLLIPYDMIAQYDMIAPMGELVCKPHNTLFRKTYLATLSRHDSAKSTLYRTCRKCFPFKVTKRNSEGLVPPLRWWQVRVSRRKIL